MNYVICIKNKNYPASLEIRKLYKRIKDETAEKNGMIRIVDESGEDYLYPAEYFEKIKLTYRLEKVLQETI